MSLRGPVVHVGYHKTATTWFQKEFYPSVRNLRYIERPVVQRALIEPRGLDFDPNRAREILNIGDDERIALCDEELSGNIHVGGLHGLASAEFARRLRATLPEAEIVIFRRDLVDHVASAYHQYVKEGGTRSPRDYVFGGEHQHRRPTFSLRHFQVEKLADHYRSLFGEDGVHVFRFEDFASGPKRFASDFADVLDLRYDESSIDWGRQPNPSFGRRSIAIARLVNLFTARDVAEKYYLVNVPGFYRASRLLLRWLNSQPWLRGDASAAAVLTRSLARRIREETGDR